MTSPPARTGCWTSSHGGWSRAIRNLICTVKFQGPTDHALAARFAALPDVCLFHLDQNKHELTFAALEAA